MLMFNFLYLHDYKAITVFGNNGTKAGSFATSDNNIVMHAEMYAMGSKYAIPSLQTLAAEKFKRGAELAWNTDAFSTAIALGFSTTPDSDKGLRSIITATILNHAETLLDKPDIEDCVRNISGLSYDLLRSRILKPSSTVLCGVCNATTTKLCRSCRKGHCGCSNGYCSNCCQYL